jgi:hypothetical protein
MRYLTRSPLARLLKSEVNSPVQARNLPVQIDAVAQELQHVRTAETQHPVLQQ